MKSNNILLYFRNKGEKEYINLMTSQNIIQENVLFPSEYIYIGNELEDNLEISDSHDDSIYIFACADHEFLYPFRVCQGVHVDSVDRSHGTGVWGLCTALCFGVCLW